MTNHPQPHTWVIRSNSKVCATASEKHSAVRFWNQFVKSSKTKGSANFGEVVTLHHFEELQRTYRPTDRDIDPRVLVIWIDSSGDRHWTIAHVRKVASTRQALVEEGAKEIWMRKIHDIATEMEIENEKDC